MTTRLIILYGVATGRSHEEMAGYVNEQIAEGWQPHEGMVTSQLGTEYLYHQPMVLYKQPAKKKKPVNRKMIKK